MAQENSPEESGDIRRKALVRLGIAGGITALALGALWWLDHSGKPPAKPKPVTPAPIVTAPVQVPTPPPPLTEEPMPLPAEENPTQAAAETAPPPEPAMPAPPPPKVSNPPARAPVPTAPAARHEAAPANSTVRATALPQPAPAQAPAPAPIPAGAGGYAVQVGIFSDPGHAQELVSKLHAAGIHAYVETRVQVGPFANQTEAEKARAVLAKMGIKGLIGPAATRK